MKKTIEYGSERNNFDLLIRKFEQATRERAHSEDAFTSALDELATAITFSVLKKLCNVGGEVKEITDINKNVVDKVVMPSDTTRGSRELRRELARNANELKNLARCADMAEANVLSDNGNWKYVTIDADAKSALDTLIRSNIEDGYDLKHTAIEYLLQYIASAETLAGEFMTIPYEVRRLKRKVYIKREDSANGWETVETTPLQETYKAVRREVEKSRAVRMASPKYTYIDFDVCDDDNASETAYIRVNGKYSVSVTNTAVSIDGKRILTTGTASIEEYERERVAMSRLNLTDREKQVLRLRIEGYGYKAIATYLGISVDNSKRCGARIREKAMQAGYNVK